MTTPRKFSSKRIVPPPKAATTAASAAADVVSPVKADSEADSEADRTARQQQELDAAQLQREKEEDEERTRQELDAQLEAMAFEEEEQRKDEERRAIRAKNTPGAVAGSRASHNANKAKLKSDLKKTSAFSTKVRLLTEAHRSSITKDVETLNLTHYVSEIVDALAEAKLKTGDVGVAVHLCCMMHQRYAGFTEDLIPKLAAPFREDPAEEDKEALRKRRTHLRLLTDLHLCGVTDASQLLLGILRKLAGERRPSTTPAQAAAAAQAANSGHQQRVAVEAAPPDLKVNDVGLIVAFAKHSGHELAGVTPRRVSRYVVPAKEATRLRVLSVEGQAQFRSLLHGVLSRLSAHLVQSHTALRKMERRFEKDRMLCGSITEEKERNLELSMRAYEKLLANVAALADAMDEDMPDLPEEPKEDDSCAVELWSAAGVGEGNLGPWDDAETKSFYEDLADLLTAVPPSQLGLTEEQWQDLRAQQAARGQDDAADESSSADGDADTDATAAGRIQFEHSGGTAESKAAEESAALALQLDKLAVNDTPAGATAAAGGAANSSSGSGTAADDDDTEYTPSDDKLDDDTDAGATAAAGSTAASSSSAGSSAVTTSQQLILLLKEELPTCYNRERADAFAVKFCSHNTRSARKKLVRALFEAPRQALDLLPQYARLVATLDQVLKDIAPALVAELRGEFKWLLRKRNVIHLIESKRRNVNYIGELVKFRVCPPLVVFQCLKGCFEDFIGANIEMACMLLESCGRFMYRTKVSHARMVSVLEIMLRFKRVKNLDPRYETMIDNAYYMCKPPDGATARRVKVRTPLQLWIRHLLCEQLVEDTIESTLRSLRRLPWSEPVTETQPVSVTEEVQKAFLRVARKRFTAVHLAADVLAGLHKNHPDLTLRVVDSILEELQRACETVGGGARDLQRRLGLSRLLGELYNYSVVNSAFIFEVLHRIINYGHLIPPAMKLPRLPASGVGEPLPAVVAPWAVYDPRAMHPCDPPGDCLRIRLVVQLLEACAEYFVVGQSRARLDKFLAYFQRYLFCKPGLPPDTEFAVLDLLDELEQQARKAAEKDLSRQARAAAAKAARTGSKTAAKAAAATAAAAEQSLLDLSEAGPLLPRYECWADAQAAVEAIEAAEAAKNSSSTAAAAAAAIATATSQLYGSSTAPAGVSLYGGATAAVGGSGNKQQQQQQQQQQRQGHGTSASSAAAGGAATTPGTAGDSDSDNSDGEAGGSNSRRNSNSGDEYDDHDSEDDDHSSDNDRDDMHDDNSSGSSDAGSDDGSDDGHSHSGSGSSSGSGAQEEEEQVSFLQPHEQFERTEADDDFERMLAKMLQENVDKSKQAARIATKSDNMDAPTVLARLNVNEATGEAPLTGGPGVAFKMLKRGAKGKLEAQAVFIPEETNLAAQAQRHNSKESDEREIIKARVLQYEADQQALDAARSRGDLAGSICLNAPISAEAARRASQKGGRGRGGGNSNKSAYNGRGSFSYFGRGPNAPKGQPGTGPYANGAQAPRL